LEENRLELPGCAWVRRKWKKYFLQTKGDSLS
jgi:hypothetical protein